MRKYLLHVLLLIGACSTISFSNPTNTDFSENSNWCSPTVKFKNTGCKTVKIYKKYGWSLYYKKTLDPGSSCNQSSSYGQEWVFKVEGDFIGNYVVNDCSYHTYEIETEGCGGNNSADCSSTPNTLSGLIYMGEYNGSKYFCSNSNNNDWNKATANNAATQYGGHLAVINDSGENEFVRKGIMANQVWIGFTDQSSEGNFEWINGDAVVYTNWSYGEPNDQGTNGNGADQTVLEKSSGKWKDRQGSDKYEFVIEVPCVTTPVCNGEITGVKFFNLDGGNNIDISNGSTYQLSQLPNLFNIEAMVTGTIESVKFNLSGALTGDNNENLAPYRYGGDNNPLILIPGDYTLTVKGYSQDNSGGEKCSEKTVHFSIAFDPTITLVDEEFEACLFGTPCGDVSQNDEIPNGSTYLLLSSTTNGTLTFEADGKFCYSPSGVGVDQFSYQVCQLGGSNNDPEICEGKVKTMKVQYLGQAVGATLKVYGKNGNTLIATFAGINSGDFLDIDATGLLSGSSATQWDFYINESIDSKIHTSCSIDILGKEFGNFYVVAYTDGAGNSNSVVGQDCKTAMAKITINSCTQPFELVDEEYETCVADEVCKDVSFNDLLPSGSTYDLVSAPTSGQLTFDEDGKFCYLPASLGNYEFQYKVCNTTNVNSGPEECSGKVKTMKVKYLGQAVNATLKVYGKNGNPLIATFANVNNGDYLDIDATGLLSGSSATQWDFYINGNVDSKIHTSCSIDILGKVFGNFYVAAYTDGHGHSNSVITESCKTATATLKVKSCGPCDLLGGDSDGDGVCNDDDCKPNDPAYPTIPGSPCDDNESLTENDRVTNDGCGCQGTPIYALVDEVFEQCISAQICGDVSLNDYVSFAGKYEVTLQPTIGVLTLNDDGTFCYQSDIEGTDEFRYQVCYYNGADANPVICKTGISTVHIKDCSPCAQLGGDTDGDGVCNDDDCYPDDPSLPALPGTACDDNDPNTEFDVIQVDGCSCAGTVITVCDNVQIGGTIGFLNSCSPTIVYCKDDGDAPLIQDCISPIGGSGDLQIVWLKSTTSCLPPTTTFDNIANDPHWMVIAGANSPDYYPGVLTESTCFLRCARRENCDMFIESNIVRIELNCDLDVDCGLLGITAKAGKVIVDGLDQAPIASVQVFSPDYSTTYFTCPGDCNIPTQVIDLAEGDYIVYVKLYDGAFNLICEKYGTYTVPPCQNVELGGYIGFGNCLGDYLYCPLTDPDVPAITNCGDPEGGVGDLEYVWLQSHSSCLPPTTTSGNIANDPHWVMIPGATGSTYIPTDVIQNTCYLRCVRREGCDQYIESNIISLIIDTDCLTFDRATVSIGDRVWEDFNGDGIQDADEPGLENVWINLQDGIGNSLIWTNTDENGEYIFFNLPAGTYQLQVSTPGGFELSPLDGTSDSEKDSDFNPGNALSPVLTLLEGDHIRNLDAGFRPTGIFLAAGTNNFDFQAVKGEEHTELYWTHNDGENVARYAIERSVNGGGYTELSAQPSQGGHSTEVYFDFDLAPETGDNYYRVKLYHTDGSVSYSEPLRVHFADLIDFMLFPNPAKDFVKINLETLIGKAVHIQIVNGMGVVVQDIKLDAVYSKYYQIDLRDLHEGLYAVWVLPSDHKAIAKQLVIGKP